MVSAASGEEIPRRSQRAVQRMQTQAAMLRVRKELRSELGREPTKSEIARAAGVTPGLVTRYWDRVGAGELPQPYLEGLSARIRAASEEEPPLLALGRILTAMVEDLSEEEIALIRLEARAQAASPEAETLRYETLNVRWRPVLTAALAERRGAPPSPDDERAVGRFVLILLDTVARWQERDFEGPVIVPAREAIRAAVPEFDRE